MDIDVMRSKHAALGPALTELVDTYYGRRQGRCPWAMGYRVGGAGDGDLSLNDLVGSLQMSQRSVRERKKCVGHLSQHLRLVRRVVR